MEYAVLISVLVAGLIAMRVYMLRAVQEKYRQSADVFGGGQQYAKLTTEVEDSDGPLLSIVTQDTQDWDPCAQAAGIVAKLQREIEGSDYYKPGHENDPKYKQHKPGLQEDLDSLKSSLNSLNASRGALDKLPPLQGTQDVQAGVSPEDLDKQAVQINNQLKKLEDDLKQLSDKRDKLVDEDETISAEFSKQDARLNELEDLRRVLDKEISQELEAILNKLSEREGNNSGQVLGQIQRITQEIEKERSELRQTGEKSENEREKMLVDERALKTKLADLKEEEEAEAVLLDEEAERIEDLRKQLDRDSKNLETARTGLDTKEIEIETGLQGLVDQLEPADWRSEINVLITELSAKQESRRLLDQEASRIVEARQSAYKRLEEITNEILQLNADMENIVKEQKALLAELNKIKARQNTGGANVDDSANIALNESSLEKQIETKKAQITHKQNRIKYYTTKYPDCVFP